MDESTGFCLTPVISSRKSKPAVRLAAILESYALQEEDVWRVLRALPEASDAEVAMLAQDPELFSQVARGNLSACERERLYRKHREHQEALPGLGSGLFNL